jgi:hypothetical protein
MLALVNYMVDYSIINVVKDQMMGVELEETQNEFYESQYGDFESLINERRERDTMLQGV